MRGKTLFSIVIAVSMMLATLPLVEVKAQTAYMEIVFENGLHEIMKPVYENFVVTLKIVDAPMITKWMVNITWDPAVLELKTGTEADVIEGPFLKRLGDTIFWVEPPELGRLPGVVCLLWNGTANGTGDLAYIDFHAKAPGDSPIHLEQHIIFHGMPTLPCDAVDGLVHVTTIPVPPPFLMNGPYYTRYGVEYWIVELRKHPIRLISKY